MFRNLASCVLLAALAALPAQGNAGTPAKVMVLGDSLSAAYGIDPDSGWVRLLQKRLDALGSGYRVINASISGDTTRGARQRLPRALEVHRPDVVVVELGGNDGLRGVPPAETRENLQVIVAAAQQAGARVLLLAMRLPPNYGAAYTRRFAAIYPALAEQLGVTLAPFVLEQIALDDALMQSDGIHPNASAQPLMLERLWPYLATLLDCVKPR